MCLPGKKKVPMVCCFQRNYMIENGLSSLFLWLDADSLRYWTLAWALFALVVLSAALSFWRIGRLNHPCVFAVLLGLSFFAFRWPVLLHNRQSSNPDESQMIGDAIKLKSDPVYWRSVDGHTVGPLIHWPLSAAGWVGFRIDYTLARTVSVLCMWAVLVCTWLAIKRFSGDPLARLLVLPLAGALILGSVDEFTQYSSEHVPMLLSSLAALLTIAETMPTVRADRPWRYLLVGVVLGGLPFAKLQAVPIGLWVGCFGLASVFLAGELDWRLRLRLASVLTAGSFVIPALILCMVLTTGQWSEFWDYYIRGNLSYASTGWYPLWQAPSHLWNMCYYADDLLFYVAPLSALLVVGGFVYARWRAPGTFRFVVFSVGLLAASLYATMAPARDFLHYLQFFLAPLTLAVAALLGPFLKDRFERERDPSAPRLRVPFHDYATYFLLLALLGQVAARGGRAYPWLGTYVENQGVIVRRAVSVMIQSMSQRGDRLAMWGWEPGLFVETGLSNATREGNTSRQIDPIPARDAYRGRYMGDIRKAKPAFFVDAVGGENFSLHDRAKQAHEIFPELAAYVAENYRLVADCEGTRLYVRKDRELTEHAKRTIAAFSALCVPLPVSQ